MRFLFLNLILVFSFKIFSADLTFSEKHIDPVLKKGTDLHSSVTFISGALLAWGTRQYDDQFRSKWVGHQKMSKADARIGDVMGSGAASLVVIGSQYLFDDQDSNYQSHLRGFVYGGLAIYTLKTVFGRNRPGSSDSHQSFPSGHTAITFMTATQLMYAYGWKAAIIAYPLAIFTGASRLADDAHWFSDTVGGAALGYFVGRATYYDESYVEEVHSVNTVTVDVIPLIDSKSFEVQVLVGF